MTVEGTPKLQLALLCDDGVSLAIYMHGTTKEPHPPHVAHLRRDVLQTLSEMRSG